MKKIVPFNNILEFNTPVYEISAISLEHNINTTDESISGVFYISGEYKSSDVLLEKENFNFELPFDIALGSDYKLDTLVVDIDDFRYELVDKNKLKVNIDLCIDGEILTVDSTFDEPLFTEKEIRTLEKNIEEDKVLEVKQKVKEDDNMSVNIQDDTNNNLIDDLVKNDDSDEVTDKVENITDNIFNGFNSSLEYVTYRVYRVLENDNLDKIIEKYKITKEELAKYNNIENIKTGDKLIIPANGYEEENNN